MTTPVPINMRFRSRIIVSSEPDGCYEFNSHHDADGYARIKEGKRGGKSFAAHRFAWELENGPIPDGMCVLHRCDNPGCVRVSHLFLGTLADNMRDMEAKGRGIHPSFTGSEHPMAKLSEDDVIEIRKLYGKGIRADAIAKRYGIALTTVYNVATRRSWKHI